MKLEAKAGVGSAASIPSQIGGAETILATNGLRDAVMALNVLFSEHLPDSIYKSALESVTSLRRTLDQSRDDLEETDVILRSLEQRIMSI